MSQEEQQLTTRENSADKSPLIIIKDRNKASIDEMNEVLSETLGHRLGRAVSAGFNIFIEYLLYAIALCVFIFIFMMERVSPFYLLAQMRENQAVQDALNPHIIQNFTLIVKTMVGLIAFFIATTAYMLRRSRKTKTNMQDAIITLRDVRGEMEKNDKELTALDEVSNKMYAAANVVANETNLDKREDK